MATTTISWGDGSGDNIYLTYPSASGDQTVTVTSDANAGSARTKTITFTAGSVTETLTVNQAGVPQQTTITRNPSSYDTTDHQYASISNASRAYTDESSSTFATIYLETGAQAETYVYFKFNTSAIPAGATIDSVSCTAKTYINNTTSSNVATRRWQLFTGTTAKGNYATISSLGTQTVSGATWTREEISDIRIRVYAKRGNSNTSTSYLIRFYGATLTITYTV